jgi:uncharacterized protein
VKLLVFSDVHDHMQHLESLLLLGSECDAALGCGDYCSPFVIRRLGEGLSCPLHLIWGNNDGDRALQVRIASGFSHVQLHGEYLDLDFGGCRIFANHYPAIAEAVASGEKYHVVCYGHDHRAHAGFVGDTLLLNPGSVMGYQPSDRSYPAPGAVLLNTQDRSLQWLSL